MCKYFIYTSVQNIFKYNHIDLLLTKFNSVIFHVATRQGNCNQTEQLTVAKRSLYRTVLVTLWLSRGYWDILLTLQTCERTLMMLINSPTTVSWTG